MKRISILLCLATVLMHVGCNSGKHEKGSETKFLVSGPMMKDTMVYKDYVCQIHSINHIEMRSQERGYLEGIYVDEGQYVHKGQLMFQIMPLIYQAEKEKALANVNFAEIEYLNTKSLADSNIVSPNELALAKAKLDKEKAELALADAHLKFTEIRAPFDGIMDRFYKRLGSLIDEGELLTTLSDNSKVWVYFNVPEAEYLDFKQHVKSDTMMKVKLLMANNQMFDHVGKVETIEADFNNETGNIAFRATFDNPQKLLRHGETGNILMPVYIRNAMIIPQKATFEVLDKKYVFTVGNDGMVQSRLIKIGQELPHLYIVEEGLSMDDKILIEGIRKVKSNEKIEFQYQKPEEVDAALGELHAE